MGCGSSKTTEAVVEQTQQNGYNTLSGGGWLSEIDTPQQNDTKTLNTTTQRTADRRGTFHIGTNGTSHLGPVKGHHDLDDDDVVMPEAFDCRVLSGRKRSPSVGSGRTGVGSPQVPGGATFNRANAFLLWESQSSRRGALASVCDIDFEPGTSHLVESSNRLSQSGGLSILDTDNRGRLVQQMGEDYLGMPQGITAGSDDIAITDLEDKTVKFLDYEGSLLGCWKKKKLLHPAGIARTPDGKFVVSNITRTNKALALHSSTGKIIRRFGETWFDWPWYVAVDHHKRIIVSERSSSTLYVYDNNAKLLSTIGSHGRQPGHFQCQNAVVLDQNNNILVADSDNYRISMFSQDGRFIKNLVTHFLSRPMCMALQDQRLAVITESDIRLYEVVQEKAFLTGVQ